MGLAEQIEKMGQALTVAEIARLLNLDEETVRRHVRRGHIPFFKIGGTIRFDPKQIATWLREKSGT